MIIDGNKDDGEAIHETSNKIKIAVEIPTDLINKDSKVKRTYFIARNHEGKVEILKGVYDEKTNTYTFETDRFSDYAIIYQDEVIPAKASATVSNSSTSSKQESKKVKTGDNTNSGMYMTFMVLCILGVVLLRKKEIED